MRQTGFRLLGPCLCAVALLAFVSAQTSGSAAPEPQPRDQPSSPSPEKSATTFHAESRLVVVDVVVPNRHREPVTGLSQSDFTVLEDGKPQAIRFFEAHVPPSASAKPAPVALPPHQYTNVSAQDPSSINIVLFDLLNTPPLDQPYAREQMVRFLQTVPPGQQVALFELGSKLRMLAGFGTTSEELLAAARKVVQHSSELLDTQAQREHDEEQLALLREGSPNQEFFDRMQDFMVESATARDQDRAKVTAQALSELARLVAGFRGRKNVIWLSEEFPVYFGPNMNPTDPNPSLRNYADIMLDTAGALSSSQMSIYPIDVRGLVTGGLANAGWGASGIGQIAALDTLHLAMDDLAKQTGGRAYYDTNDLGLAMQRSFENGSHYYTLAYVPPSRSGESKFHHIKIQLAQSGM